MSALGRLLGPLRRQLRLIVSRAVITVVDDALKIQGVQITALAGETRDNVERFQDYGFTSVPHAGAEAVVVFAGGNRDHGIVVKVDDRRYRLKGLAKGEVAMYSDEGDSIHFKRGRKIVVTTETAEVNAAVKASVTSPLVELIAATKVTMTTPLVEMSGGLNVAGLISGAGGVAISGGAGGSSIAGNLAITGGALTHDGTNISKTHVHGGVQPGAGNTGGPQ